MTVACVRTVGGTGLRGGVEGKGDLSCVGKRCGGAAGV